MLYKADEPAWPMGCIAQQQLCKDGACTGLGSAVDNFSSLSEGHLGLNSTFLGVLYYLNLTKNLHDIILSLGLGRCLERTKGLVFKSVRLKTNIRRTSPTGLGPFWQ